MKRTPKYNGTWIVKIPNSKKLDVADISYRPSIGNYQVYFRNDKASVFYAKSYMIRFCDKYRVDENGISRLVEDV